MASKITFGREEKAKTLQFSGANKSQTNKSVTNEARMYIYYIYMHYAGPFSIQT